MLTVLDLRDARAAMALAPRPPPPVPTQEAASPVLFLGQPGTAEAGWRRISQTGSMRDLTPQKQDRMQAIAYYLWVTNPFAQRLVEIVTDYVVGEGVTIRAEDPEVAALLERYWNDEVNARDENLPVEVSELAVFGEQLCICPSNPVNGMVRLGSVDAMHIEAIEYATLAALPGRAVAYPSRVLLRRGLNEREQPMLRIVHRDEDPGSPTFGQLAGDAFYSAINKARAGTRGISDLFAAADWIDGYDQMLWSLMAQMDSLSRFIWDVELAGHTEDQIIEWLAKHGAAPRPNSVRAHNEKVKWSAVSPSINAADKSEGVRQVKLNILGGRGLPEHFFGSGADTNLATAIEQGGPALKMMTRRQRLIRAIEERKANYQVDRGISTGVLAPDVDRKFQIEMPQLAAKDTAKAAASLQGTAAALVQYQQAGVVDRKTMAAVAVRMMAAGFGLEVDPEQMLDDAALEDEVRQARYYAFPAPPGMGAPPSGAAPEQMPRPDGETPTGRPASEEYSDDQPRDDQGQWSEVGSAGGAASSGAGAGYASALESWTASTARARAMREEAGRAITEGSPETSPLVMGIRESTVHQPVYRGVYLPENSRSFSLEAGGEIQLLPSSFSLDEDVADSFAHAGSGTPLILEVHGSPKDPLHGIDVGKARGNPGEREVISGGKFRVEKVAKNYDGSRRLVLRQVGVF